TSASSSKFSSNLRVPIGFVLRPHGIQGLLRVRAGDSLVSLSHVYLDDERVKILKVQRDKQEFLVELEGLSDRDAAEKCKGAQLSVDREQLPPLAEGEIYLFDLVGCRVFDSAGADLGEVISVESTGAQDLLTIRGARTWQLPFVSELL